MNNYINIDFTPITEKYDKETIDNICCWAINTLYKTQKSKLYKRLNPFKHNYMKDYSILEKTINKIK